MISNFFFGNKKSKVIYYHDVHKGNRCHTNMSTDIEIFKEHVNHVLKNYDIVKTITRPQKQLIICFDDGFKGIYDNKDYFIENDIPVIIFIITAFIGRKGYLSENQIKELASFSCFSFGAHTHNHINLGDLPDQELKFELETSKKILEQILDQEVFDFCYPRGSFSKKALEFSKNAEYKNLYTSIPGDYNSVKETGFIYRNLVQSDDLKTFKLSLNGAQSVFRKRRFKQHYKN